MVSNYHSIVKKYLDRNRNSCVLPEYIQRGWNRIYTLEEQEFNKRPCIIGSDVQLPNSVVRHRLGTIQISRKANLETFRKVFELPDELLMNLSNEHQLPDMIDDEKLSFEWNDDEDDDAIKRRKSIVGTIIHKQREKRRKYDDYKYDYDNSEPLPLDEILEEIRTNIGKDLKPEDLQLITDLMQTISRNKQDQVMNIYDELTDIHLISKFGGVPKLVQALQEIQKAFEQVAMKTNVASIETIIDVLLEKDNTYRVAVELLNSFNENMTKNRQQQKFNLTDKSGDISDHDHTLFNMLIQDRISRLPTSDLTTLINDLQTIRNFDTSKVNQDHDDQVKFLSEQLNIIFTRAHFDGIKTTIQSMKSPISSALNEFIDRIESSLKIKLTEQECVIIESYIQDHLALLNENELKTFYERLAQQGTLKRHTGSGELNQTIILGLMEKIDTVGLGALVENIKEAHLDIDSINGLVQELISVNNHLQTQSSISIEQIQTQLEMAYFIETRDLSTKDIENLSRSANLYSIIHVFLVENATQDECSRFLEHLKSPFIRLCIQRILNSNSVDLNTVSNQFYNQHINDLLHELIHGSEEFNQTLLLRQIKEQLKKNKDLTEKFYRQMLKEKLINTDIKVKIDTDKKKLLVINNEINQILINKDDRIKQLKLIELLDRIDIILPERIKHWYNNKTVKQISSSKLKKSTIDGKLNIKEPIKVVHSKGNTLPPGTTLAKRRTTDKSINPPPTILKNRSTRETKTQLPTTTTSVKHGNEQKKPSIKSQPKVYQTKERSKILSDPSADNNEGEKLPNSSQIPLTSKSNDNQKNTLIAANEQPVVSSTTTKTDALNIDIVSKLQVDDDSIQNSQAPVVSLSIPQETTEQTDFLTVKREKDNQQMSDDQLRNETNIDIEYKEEFGSLQNILASDITANNMQTIAPINIEQKTNVQFDVLQQSHDLDDISSLTRLQILQTDFETIQSKNITSGKVDVNGTFSFEVQQNAALLLYSSPLSNDPKEEIHTILTGKIAEFVDDPQYEKTKAQRVLAKTILPNTNNVRQQTEGDTNGTTSLSSDLVLSNAETISTQSDIRKLSDPSNVLAEESLIPTSTPSLTNIKVSTKVPRRTLNKSLKQPEDIYISCLTDALSNLFSRSEYDNNKLRKIHDELIASGHISPLNEFYRSSNEALRVTLDYCITYYDLIKWTLSLLQTNNKLNLIDFGHDLYSIAIDLDLLLNERIDNIRYASELQENLKHELQTITETDLREINSYLNAAQIEKLVNISKKLNVVSKDRMIIELYTLVLHLIQVCHTFPLKYRPMQTHIREIAEKFQSRAVANLARKIDEIEKRLSKTFAITFVGVSKRMHESRFILIK